MNNILTTLAAALLCLSAPAQESATALPLTPASNSHNIHVDTSLPEMTESAAPEMHWWPGACAPIKGDRQEELSKLIADVATGEVLPVLNGSERVSAALGANAVGNFAQNLRLPVYVVATSGTGDSTFSASSTLSQDGSYAILNLNPDVFYAHTSGRREQFLNKIRDTIAHEFGHLYILTNYKHMSDANITAVWAAHEGFATYMKYLYMGDRSQQSISLADFIKNRRKYEINDAYLFSMLTLYDYKNNRFNTRWLSFIDNYAAQDPKTRDEKFTERDKFEAKHLLMNHLTKYADKKNGARAGAIRAYVLDTVQQKLENGDDINISQIIFDAERNISYWVGKCHNRTLDKKAGLELSFYRTSDSIAGYLLVKGTELWGSGPARGTLQQSRIKFHTPSASDPNGGIDWTGTLSDDRIRGTYRVRPGKDNTLQYGTFELRKK